MRLQYYIEEGDRPEIVVQERLTAIASELERIADALEADEEETILPDGGTDVGGSEYPTEVEVVERDDGYYSVRTHEDSAMGRRILLLKPEELESLRRSLCTHNGQDLRTDGGVETVYVKGNGHSRGKELILHTDPDCRRLRSAKNVFEKDRSVYPDDARLCQFCTGEFEPSGGDPTTGSWVQLEAMDAEDLVTDGGTAASVSKHGIRPRGSWYDAEWIECPRCRGTGENVECIDDLCHAQGHCMHGDNLCALCEGFREISRELERRWYQREPFESVELPAQDLRRRGKLHAVARERYQDTADGSDGGGR